LQLPVLALSQQLLNGDFESGVTECMIDLSNEDFTNLVPNVVALGEYNKPDLLTDGCNNGVPQKGENFVKLQAEQGLSDVVALELSEPLQAFKSYYITFYARKPNNIDNDSYRFAIGGNTVPTSNGGLIFTIENLTTSWQKYTTVFKPPSVIYYITVLIETGPYMEVYIDNFEMACPEFSLGPDTTYCEFSPRQLTIPVYFNNIRWRNGSTENSILATRPGIYAVEADFNETCPIFQDEIELIEDNNNCDCQIYLPNAFSPNEDGHNDLWAPLLSCDLQSYSLMVFDKWGNKIFEAFSPDEGWDGKWGTRLVGTGVFSYIINYQDVDGNKFIKSGNVTIIR
jgi:gliding motility-associated-like protein